MLNLLVGDICELPQNNEILLNAAKIAKFVKFRTAFADEVKSQLQAERAAGHRGRFVSLPVPTRWYSQVQCVRKVLNLREIICMVTANPGGLSRITRNTGKAEYVNLVKNEDFWVKLVQVYVNKSLAADYNKKREDCQQYIIQRIQRQK